MIKWDCYFLATAVRSIFLPKRKEACFAGNPGDPLPPVRKKTDLAAALGYLNTILKRRSIVFILSDFFDTRFEKALQGLKRRHDVIAIRIEDPRESLPEIGLLCLQDLDRIQDND